jgi:serine/threonine-protein kinase
VKPPLDADLIHHALAGVQQSREFRRSPGLQRFLVYLVDAVLTGHTDALKESVIGIEVFHRAPGYDAKADPIVRVEANRLRRKLEAYYESEGANDLLRISLPSGAYVPVIERRSSGRIETAKPPATKPTRLLVLPLANLTGQADREFFSDGLTEELIHRLGSVPGLRVLARTTAFAWKGTSLDVARLRERFAVDVLIEGGVRQSSDQVRVNLRFIAAQDEACIWSGQFERRLENALQLQEDVADAVARELKLRALGSGVTARQVLPPAVHEAYLLGCHFLHRLRPEQTPSPASYFRRAIALDPTFAPAYVGLADCLYERGMLAEVRPVEVLPEAVTLLEKALRLDPGLADAHRSLGVLHNAYHWDSEACRQSLARCLELDPGNAAGRSEYGASYLTPLGRLEEARGWLLEAHELDPLSPQILVWLGLNAWSLNQAELCLSHVRQAVELDPHCMLGYLGVALASLTLERWDEMEAAIAAARASSPPINSNLVEAWIRAKQGRTSKAPATPEGSARPGGAGVFFGESRCCHFRGAGRKRSGLAMDGKGDGVSRSGREAHLGLAVLPRLGAGPGLARVARTCAAAKTVR